MKKLTKLALRRETIKVLVDRELPVIVGGVDESCQANTRQISGCRVALDDDPAGPPAQ